MEQISTVEYVEYAKKLNPKGYILINYNGEWILEHRFLMSLYIGRPLLPEEKVHHIDFNKLNNDINNLVLMINKFHNHFHRQVSQFKMTGVRIREIQELKRLMELERKKNIIEVTI